MAAAGELARSGRLLEAELACLVLLRTNPAHATDAWLLLGSVQLDLGKTDNAIASLEAAQRAAPQDAVILLRLAVAYFRAQRMPAARATLQHLVDVHPHLVEGAFHLAYLHELGGETVLAEQWYRRALTIRPDHLDSLSRLGLLIQLQKRWHDALPLLEQALTLAPGRIDLAAAAARASFELRLHANAVTHAQGVLRHAPDDVPNLLLLGVCARHIRRYDLALKPLRHASELAPDNAMAQAEYGLASIDVGHYEQAVAALSKALALAPELPMLGWFNALLLPVVPANMNVVRQGLSRFRQGVETLLQMLGGGNAKIWREARQGIERSVPFYLHYLPVDTTRETCCFGDLIGRVMAHEFPRFLRPLEWRALEHGGRLRVGFVCSAFRNHTLMRYFSGWLLAIDRAKFEVSAWHLNSERDAMTERVATVIDHFHEAAALSTDGIAASIRDSRLDALIYLDIGMNARAQMLAALRLAPVQCAAYGHPATSGSASVDYFLSAEAMEPANGQQHYRERLVRLPRLGVVPLAPPAPGRCESFPRSDGRPVLLCLQNLIKLVPAFDDILVGIAQRGGARIVLFLESEFLSERLRARLRKSFSGHDLELDEHVVFLPRSDYGSYLGAVAAADLILDSPHFSGGATSLDALSVGTPILTLEGEWMRGRQTAGMLRLMDVPELIAQDAQQYIDLAVELCRDASRRNALRQKLLANRNNLFLADDVVPALQKFLVEAAHLAAHEAPQSA